MQTSAAGLRQKIEAVSLEMCESSELGDWHRAVELGTLRRDLLEALLKVADPAEEVDLLERIMASDRLLANSAHTARAQIAEELAGLRANKRAVGAYREAASRES